MEDSLENWISEMDEVLNGSDRAFDEEEFLRGILEHEREHPSNEEGSFEEATTSLRGRSGTHKSNTSNSNSNSNSIKSFKKEKSCATYLLSFDNSSAEPITHIESSPKGLGLVCSNKRTAVKELEEWKPQPKKKITSSSHSQHHIIAERKRRQQLTGSIIALSAIIPGLKKMDKAYVLGEAINYTKQLQERVKELENQNKEKRVESATLVRKSQSNDNGETNKESLFEVEVRVLDEEVFIGIHCEKQKDTVFKIHALLGKLHLSVNTSTVLPFGSSTLVINIIAQMDEGYKMSMDELVKKLREYLLEVYDSNNGPC